LGTAVGKVRQAISEEPRGVVGARSDGGTRLGPHGHPRAPAAALHADKVEEPLARRQSRTVRCAPAGDRCADGGVGAVPLRNSPVVAPRRGAKLTNLEKLYWYNSKAPNATVRIPAAVFAALPPECIDFEDTRVAITGAPGGFDVVLSTALTENLKNRDVCDFLAAFRGSAVAAPPRWRHAMIVGMADAMIVGMTDAGKTTLVGKMTGKHGALETFTASALSVINKRSVTFGVDVVT
jgi:hypothetical protein